jgi:hypothetical protein
VGTGFGFELNNFLSHETLGTQHLTPRLSSTRMLLNVPKSCGMRCGSYITLGGLAWC